MLSAISVAGNSALRISPVSGQAAQSASGGAPQRQDVRLPDSNFSLKVDVDLVTVDTIVRDKEGVVVGDLRSQDFVVYDNGVAQPLTHFSRDRLPLAVAVLIDRSPSIRRYLPDLRSAGLAALQHLKAQDQVVLYSFDQCPARLSDLTEDRALIAEKISQLKIGMSTNIWGSLFESARYLHEKAPDRRRAIILISDNYSTVFPMNEDDVLAEVLEASATLYSIRTAGDNASYAGNRGSIDRIAKESGGEVLKLGDADKLSAALEKAISNLRMGYTLGFAPPQSGKEGSYHRLSVKLASSKSCPGCSVQARSGYYSGPQALVQSGISMKNSTPPYNCDQFIAESSMQQRIWLAANEPADLSAVSFQVGTESIADSRGRQQIKVEVHVDPESVKFRTIDDRFVARVDMVVYYGDAKGDYLGEEWQTVDMQLREEAYRQFLHSGVMADVLIPLKKPGQILKVVVGDVWSGRVGSRLLSMK